MPLKRVGSPVLIKVAEGVCVLDKDNISNEFSEKQCAKIRGVLEDVGHRIDASDVCLKNTQILLKLTNQEGSPMPFARRVETKNPLFDRCLIQLSSTKDSFLQLINEQPEEAIDDASKASPSQSSHLNEQLYPLFLSENVQELKQVFEKMGKSMCRGYEKFMRYAVKRYSHDFHSTDEMKSLIAHELGHQLEHIEMGGKEVLWRKKSQKIERCLFISSYFAWIFPLIFCKSLNGMIFKGFTLFLGLQSICSIWKKCMSFPSQCNKEIFADCVAARDEKFRLAAVDLYSRYAKKFLFVKKLHAELKNHKKGMKIFHFLKGMKIFNNQEINNTADLSFEERAKFFSELSSERCKNLSSKDIKVLNPHYATIFSTIKFVTGKVLKNVILFSAVACGKSIFEKRFLIK